MHLLFILYVWIFQAIVKLVVSLCGLADLSISLPDVTSEHERTLCLTLGKGVGHGFGSGLKEELIVLEMLPVVILPTVPSPVRQEKMTSLNSPS